jgi:hypothetical protein
MELLQTIFYTPELYYMAYDNINETVSEIHKYRM